MLSLCESSMVYVANEDKRPMSTSSKTTWDEAVGEITSLGVKDHVTALLAKKHRPRDAAEVREDCHGWSREVFSGSLVSRRAETSVT